MARVIYCKPNGPEEIDGIKFAPHAQGMISDDISDEAVVARLLTIPGFQAEDYKPDADLDGSAASTIPVNPIVPSKGDKDGDGVNDKDQRKALMARLGELGVKCSPAISLDNLKLRVAAEEEAAKNKASTAGGQQEQQQQDGTGAPTASTPAAGSSEGAGAPAADGKAAAPTGGSTTEEF